MAKYIFRRKNICSFVIGVLWAISSFFLVDLKVFTFSKDVICLFNYFCCKFVATAVVIISVRLLLNISNDYVKKIAFFASPILVILLCVAFYYIKIMPRGYDIEHGDMGIILDNAKNLKCYYDFNYLTSWFYIVALMICPIPYFIIVLKIFVWTSFFCYVFMFVNKYIFIDKNKSYRVLIIIFMYLLFLFPPVLLLVTNCHRIYCYTPFLGLIYFAMYSDWVKNVQISLGKIVVFMIVVASVSQWRPEGIFCLLLFAVLLWKRQNIQNIKVSDAGVKKLLILYLMLIFVNVLVSFPQNVETFYGRQNYSDVRLHPLYAYRLTTMFFEGNIDEDKYKNELEAINKVISIEAIKKLNESLGEKTYEDGFIRWLDEYVGVTANYSMDNYRAYVRGEILQYSNKGFGSEEYMAYADACKKLFSSEPVFFLKSCLNTFLYTEKNGYKVGVGDNRIPMFVIKISYSLILPAIVNVVVLFFSFRKKRWFSFLLSICLFLQAGSVLVLAPAAYYKYYLPECFAVYLGLFIYIIESR